MTSDTVALARIFIQNRVEKALDHLGDHRFDWPSGNCECDFPDPEFFELMRKASKLPNVILVSANPYEIDYAKQRDVDLGERVIRACACYLPDVPTKGPQDPQKKRQFFVHKRTEEVQIHAGGSFPILKIPTRHGNSNCLLSLQNSSRTSGTRGLSKGCCISLINRQTSMFETTKTSFAHLCPL